MLLQQGNRANHGQNGLLMGQGRIAKQRGFSLPSFPPRNFASSIISKINLFDSRIQFVIAIVLGGGLGLFVTAASTLDTDQMGMLVVALVAPFLLLIAGGIRRPLLAIIMIETALDVTSYVNFQQPDQGQISGYTVSLTTFALVGLYAIWFAELLTKHDTLPKGMLRMILAPLCYVVFASMTIFWAPSFVFGTFEIYQIWHALALFVYLVATIRTREDVIFCVLMLSVGVIIQSFGQIFVFATGKNINLGQLSTGAANTYLKEFRERPGGFIGSPIDATAFFELYLPPLLAFLFLKTKKIYVMLVLLALGMGGVGLLLAQSRMGWIAILVSCGIVCFFAWRRGFLPMWVPIVTILALFVLIFLFQDTILGRFTNDDNGSARSRVVMTQLGFQILRDYPFFGVGINNFAAVVKHYLTPDFTQEWFYAIHDKYLLLWVEIGIPGTLAFISYLIITVRRGWQVWQRNDPLLSPLALAFTAAMLSQMMHMFVDVFHSKPQVQGLWIVAALITAMFYHFKEDTHVSLAAKAASVDAQVHIPLKTGNSNHYE